MFCGKCGSSLPDGVKFCPNCGNIVSAPSQTVSDEPAAQAQAPTQSTPAQQIPAQAIPTQSIPVQNSSVTPAYQQPVTNAYPNVYAPVNNGKKVKTGKKKKAPIIICVILAVVLAVGVAAACMWQNIARSALGEAGFYAWREAKTTEKIFAVKGMDTLGDNDSLTISSKVKVNAEDGVYDKAFDAVSADVNFSYSDQEQKAVAVVGLVAEDETKVNANVSFEKGKLGISIPDLTEQTYYMDLGMGEEKIELDYETIGTELLNIYKQLDKEHIRVNTVVDKRDFNGQKCRNVTFTVDGNEAAELLVDFLTAVKEDKALINALDPALAAAFNGTNKMNPDSKDTKTYEDYKEEFLENFDLIIKQIKKSVGEKDIVLVLSYASDSKGYIVNRTVMFSADGKDVFRVAVDTFAKAGILNLEFTSEENETTLALTRDRSARGDSFHIIGGSVEMNKGEAGNGVSFEIYFNNIRVENINGVNVLIGEAVATLTPVADGKEKDESTVKINLNLENNGTYDIKARYELGEVSYDIDIESTLSATADLSRFVKPDEKGLTDFDKFVDSMSDGVDKVAEDILKDADPDLLLQISKTAQLKQCRANEKLIEDNLVKYIKTGNGGKPFKNVNDVLAKQAAYDKMFKDGHPPYCTNGNSNGVKYKITVAKNLSHEIKCQNRNCPNYGH